MFSKVALVIVLVALSTISPINSLVVCQQNACDIVKCKNVSADECNKPNQDLRKGGWCNCCTVCFTTLGQNEQCPHDVTIGGPPPTAACQEGLKCIGGKCVGSTITRFG